MMEYSSPTCPICHLNDKTYKVSLLYLEGTARLFQHENTNQPELEQLLADWLPEGSSGLAQSQAVQRVVAALAPPEGEKQTTRRIHPDWLMVFFGVLGVVLLYRVAGSQPDQFGIIGILFAAALLAYLLARQAIMRRYTASIQREQAENARVEQAIGHWMRLYLCGRDQCVFDPQSERSTSLEQIRLLLE